MRNPASPIALVAVAVLALTVLVPPPPTVQAQDEGTLPTRVLHIIIDGMNADDFAFAIDQGLVPNLAGVLEGGTRADVAYAGFPSFTAPMHTSQITGAWPARTGIVGNVVYVREEDATRDYFGDFSTVDTFLSEEAITTFEAVEQSEAGGVTVAAGEFQDRGADRSFWDSTSTSGGQAQPGAVPDPTAITTPGPPPADLPDGAVLEAYTELNATLQAEVHADLQMADYAAASAADFTYMALFQVQTDGFGEHYGPHTRKYLEVALANADANLGRVFDAMRTAGTFAETLVVVSTDHGLRKLDPEQDPEDSFEEAVAAAGEDDVVVSGTAQGVWLTNPDRDEVDDPQAFAARMDTVEQGLLGHPMVTVTARWRTPEDAVAGRGVIDVRGDGGGHSVLTVIDPGEHVEDAEYTYEVVVGPDPLAADACYPAVLEPEEPRGPATGAHCQPEGIDGYPFAIRRLLGLLGSPLAPDVVFSRSGLVDSGPGDGGGGTHGELDWEVSRIPLWVGGAGAATEPVARPIFTVDVAPTILAALGRPVPAQMDGVVRCELLVQELCPDTSRRVAGATRVTTAVRAARTAFPDGARTVVLARADDFPDALAAAPLAAAVDGPVLLTGPDGLDPAVATELIRLRADEVLMAGGTTALSAQLEDDLHDLGLRTDRLGGPTRFHTAVALADAVAARGGPVDQVLLARGDAFPDALVAGTLAAAVGAPILLTEPDVVPDVTGAALDALLQPGQTVRIAGGSDAVSGAVADRLAADGFAVARHGGATRDETAAALVTAALDEGLDPDPVLLASSTDFPDALAAAPAATALGGVLLVVDPADLDASPAVRDLLAARAEAIDTLLVVGGPVAVDPAVERRALEVVDDG